NPPMNIVRPNSYRTGPDERGLFGIYGGRFVAETLMPLILELEKAYNDAKADPAFQAELEDFLEHYVGRPSPLYYAERLSEHLGGAKIYFKRDELNHTGAHKINNVMGQILLARRIGNETKRQMLHREGRLPNSLVAAIGGGSNAIGLFHPFLDDEDVEIYGVEAAGHGLDSGKHAASITGGRPGVLHGNRTYLLMDD